MHSSLWRSFLVCTAVVSLLSSCGKAPPPASVKLPRPVKLVQASTTAPSINYSASGRIKACQRAELSFDRGDVLAELPATQGQRIQKGDVLARLDIRNLVLQEKSRQARFEETQRQYERMQRLFEKQAIAEADLERARSAFESAEADLLQTRKDLAESELRAPFDGHVAATYVDRYQIVQAKQRILVVHDLSSYEIEINIPETFILNASGRATNAQMSARFEHLPGQVFPVELKDFATEADPQTLTYAAVFRLPTPQGAVLLPGMSATIDLRMAPLPQSDTAACWAPQPAIFSVDGETSLAWVVDPDTLKVAQRRVTTGAVRDGMVQVLEGLAPGDLLAASGLYSLEEGQVVRPYDASAN